MFFMNLSINPIKFVPVFSGRNVGQYADKNQSYLTASDVDTFEFTNRPELDKKQELKNKVQAKLAFEDYDGILSDFGMEVKQNDRGEKILSSFHQPSKDTTFADLGVDENALLKGITGVDGDFNIAASNVSDLPNLKYIRGDVDMGLKNDVSMPNLNCIGGSVRAPYTSNIDMSSLSVINGHANFEGATDVNMDSLVKITDSAKFVDAENVRLSNLTYIGDDADFSFSSGIELPNLTDVGKNFIAKEADIKDLTSLRFVKGSLDVSDSEVNKLAVGIMVDGDIHAEHSKLEAIRTGAVGGSVFIEGTTMEPRDFIHQNIGGHIQTA